MKHLAIGYACNLNNIFVRFPYEKCKTIFNKFRTTLKRKSLVKKIFREGVKLIIDDIIENNNTFIAPSMKNYSGEVHIEAIKGSQFEELRKRGKFKDVDFLESLFTGHQMYIYVRGASDKHNTARVKIPIYLGKFYKDKITKYTNQGRQYC